MVNDASRGLQFALCVATCGERMVVEWPVGQLDTGCMRDSPVVSLAPGEFGATSLWARTVSRRPAHTSAAIRAILSEASLSMPSRCPDNSEDLFHR